METKFQEWDRVSREALTESIKRQSRPLPKSSGALDPVAAYMFFVEEMPWAGTD